MRRLAEVVLLYKSCQLLLNNFNIIFQSFLQTFLNNGATIIAVILTFALVKFNSTMSIVELCVLLMGVFGTTVFLILTYTKFGDVNDQSKKILGSWKRWNGWESPYDRNLMLKYMRASTQLKVELNSFGFYKKQNTVRIVGRLIYYTAKLLVMTKKFKILNN